MGIPDILVAHNLIPINVPPNLVLEYRYLGARYMVLTVSIHSFILLLNLV